MGAFPSTRWSIVQLARSHDAERAKAALAELCTAYWPPLYAFTRRRGAAPDDAAELIQDFFAALLDGDAFAGFDRGRGRFRSWLLGALRHHDLKRREAASAEKRGGRIKIVDLDTALAEAELASFGANELTPEAAYERAWSLGVLRRAEERLRGEYVARRAEAEFAALAPILLQDDDTPYARLAERLGKSEGAVKVAVHRLRKRFGDLLRREVAETVADPREIDAELRELISAVRRL